MYRNIRKSAKSSCSNVYYFGFAWNCIFGIYNVVVDASFFVGSVVFGFLWDNYNLSIAISFIMALTSIDIIGMLAFVKYILLAGKYSHTI